MDTVRIVSGGGGRVLTRNRTRETGAAPPGREPLTKDPAVLDLLLILAGTAVFLAVAALASGLAKL